VVQFIVAVIICGAILLGLIGAFHSLRCTSSPHGILIFSGAASTTSRYNPHASCPIAMVENRAWFDRQFESGLHEDRFPGIIERLRGTPARLEERLLGMPTDVLVQHRENKWSIQENAGHLWDLEPLWEARLDDLVARVQQLRTADLQNRKTHEAQHNARPLEQILGAFRKERSRLVSRLENLSAADLRHIAIHPRLHQPMTSVDLFFFVAEHDDHHLATVSQLFRTLRSSGT
jgi:uncharacterized damage-inducible protein DinB